MPSLRQGLDDTGQIFMFLANLASLMGVVVFNPLR